ncbi:MAG: serine kinase [Candidatus Stahlbacteria bacterium]|nr:serine kinase [Candidatus Stahlbacteria bacterium]
MLKLNRIVKELNLRVIVAHNIDKVVSGGYASDLLSDVIAHSQKDNIWITLQTHQNIVAVASLKELVGIIIVNGRMPEDETIKKAKQEKIPILVTELSTFEVVGRLYGLGVRGIKQGVSPCLSRRIGIPQNAGQPQKKRRVKS